MTSDEWKALALAGLTAAPRRLLPVDALARSAKLPIVANAIVWAADGDRAAFVAGLDALVVDGVAESIGGSRYRLLRPVLADRHPEPEPPVRILPESAVVAEPSDRS